MSADKSKGAELEEQFILRLPLEQAEIIREWLRKSAMSRQKDGEDDAMGDDNDQDQLTLNFSGILYFVSQVMGCTGVLLLVMSFMRHTSQPLVSELRHPFSLQRICGMHP